VHLQAVFCVNDAHVREARKGIANWSAGRSSNWQRKMEKVNASKPMSVLWIGVENGDWIR